MTTDSTQPATTVTLQLDDASLGRLANRVAERLAPLMSTPTITTTGWLDAKGAARYLGFGSVHPLHKLTARREIAFSQDTAGGKVWFRVVDLDAYRLRGRIEARDGYR